MCVLFVYHPYCRKIFIKITPTADVADLMTINQSVNPRSHFTDVLLVFADLASVFPAQMIPIPNTPQTAWLWKTSAIETAVQSIKLATKSNVDCKNIIIIFVVCCFGDPRRWSRDRDLRNKSARFCNKCHGCIKRGWNTQPSRTCFGASNDPADFTT